MNVCSIWPFAQNSDDFYFFDIWECARYFVAALFKELDLITIRERWGLESRSRTSRFWSRLLWQSLGLVSKFELGLGGYGLDYITASNSFIHFWGTSNSFIPTQVTYKFFVEICTQLETFGQIPTPSITFGNWNSFIQPLVQSEPSGQIGRVSFRFAYHIINTCANCNMPNQIWDN